MRKGLEIMFVVIACGILGMLIMADAVYGTLDGHAQWAWFFIALTVLFTAVCMIPICWTNKGA